jgi:hypothetical protein
MNYDTLVTWSGPALSTKAPSFPQLCHDLIQRFHNLSQNLTTQTAGFASEVRMYVEDNMPWEQFEQKFRDAFGREMTADEHRWFQAIWTIANSRNEQKKNAAAA